MACGKQVPRVSVLWAVTLLFLLTACAAVQDVRVTYRVPEPGMGLKGRTVFIDFEDRRQDKEILGPGARKAFTYHSGNVALFLLQDEGPPDSAGLKDVPSLFRDVFGRRIELLAGRVTDRPSEADAVLSIVLNTFSLDLEDRRWMAEMAYEARLSRDDRLRARQEMSGEAERIRIMGLKQADQVVGELFTDVVNRLDLEGLFDKAGL